jgi:hypothetical protein
MVEPNSIPLSSGERSLNPILILAPARSFTSVVAAMLGQHPQLYAFPELNLFRAERVSDLFAFEDSDPVPHQISGLLRALAQLHDGDQTAEAVDAAGGWLKERSTWRCPEVMDYMLELVAPRTGIDKSPTTLLEDGALQRALVSYPDARFIHLVRHPVTTARSMHEHWAENLRGHTPTPADCLMSWYLLHRRASLVLEDLRKKAPEKGFRVRAEDVLNDPGATLARLAEWLGVSALDAALAEMLHPERSPYVGFGPSTAPWGADGAFLADPFLRAADLPSAVEFPDSWDVPPQLIRAGTELAERLGY